MVWMCDNVLSRWIFGFMVLRLVCVGGRLICCFSLLSSVLWCFFCGFYMLFVNVWLILFDLGSSIVSLSMLCLIFILICVMYDRMLVNCLWMLFGLFMVKFVEFNGIGGCCLLRCCMWLWILCFDEVGECMYIIWCGVLFGLVLFG